MTHASANVNSQEPHAPDALDGLALRKRLDPQILRKWGVRADGDAIVMQYYDETGLELFCRRRSPEGVTPRFLQPTGVGAAPYGLWRLDRARKFGRLYLCEGESDCWAMWSATFTALGIPGAQSSRCFG